MTEEEKKAIECLKNRLEILHSNTQWATENSIKVVLNLIEKQQKEIEYLKNEKERIGKLQYDASETCFKNKEIILKQQKEIEELKKNIKEIMRKDRDCLTFGYHSAYVGLLDDLIKLIEEE